MAFNYGKIATLADSILAEYGQSVTITKRIEGEYDPATGSVAVTESIQTSKGVLIDYGYQGMSIARGQEMADGSVIKLGDKQLLLSAIGISAVNVGDLATLDGKTRTI